MSQFADKHWHLDKRVPLALIITILVQSGGAIWWAASVSERMAQVEEQVVALTGRSQVLTETVSRERERVAVLTEKLSATNENLERLRADISDTNALLRNLLMQNNRRIDDPINGGR